PTRPERVTRRERLPRSRRQDAELDQPVDVVRVDPGPLGDLLPGVSPHGSPSIASCLRAGVTCSASCSRVTPWLPAAAGPEQIRSAVDKGLTCQAGTAALRAAGTRG